VRLNLIEGGNFLCPSTRFFSGARAGTRITAEAARFQSGAFHRVFRSLFSRAETMARKPDRLRPLRDAFKVEPHPSGPKGQKYSWIGFYGKAKAVPFQNKILLMFEMQLRWPRPAFLGRSFTIQRYTGSKLNERFS
jgi:hypothetical protein